MKKLLVMSALAIGLASLAGCEADASQTSRFTNSSDDIVITTDKKTNCKYIIYSGYKQGGITPLLKSNGLPDCGK